MEVRKVQRKGMKMAPPLGGMMVAWMVLRLEEKKEMSMVERLVESLVGW